MPSTLRLVLPQRKARWQDSYYNIYAGQPALWHSAVCAASALQAEPRYPTPCMQAPAEDPKAAAELASLREQLAELASLASTTAKVEGVGEGADEPSSAASSAGDSQHVAATLRTLLQARCFCSSRPPKRLRSAESAARMRHTAHRASGLSFPDACTGQIDACTGRMATNPANSVHLSSSRPAWLQP